MKLTKTLLYALVCLKHLAQKASDYVEVKEIATAHAIPEAYCQKVLFCLAKQGLVSSRKGKGFQLEIPLERLSLEQVSKALATPQEEEIEVAQNGNLGILRNWEVRLSGIFVSEMVA